jgi:hypothetical protein
MGEEEEEEEDQKKARFQHHHPVTLFAFPAPPLPRFFVPGV